MIKRYRSLLVLVTQAGFKTVLSYYLGGRFIRRPFHPVRVAELVDALA